MRIVVTGRIGDGVIGAGFDFHDPSADIGFTWLLHTIGVFIQMNVARHESSRARQAAHNREKPWHPIVGCGHYPQVIVTE